MGKSFPMPQSPLLLTNPKTTFRSEILRIFVLNLQQAFPKTVKLVCESSFTDDCSNQVLCVDYVLIGQRKSKIKILINLNGCLFKSFFISNSLQIGHCPLTQKA